MRLGLAANQPTTALLRLNGHGLGRFFTQREDSVTFGPRKPAPRLFLTACETLGVPPRPA